MDRLGERRLSKAIIGASVALFLGLFLVLRPGFETPDEAKYIGLGLNILAGRGLVTDFGASFLNHPPLWPLALAIPRAWLGLDALAVGHVLDALSGAGLIALAAAMAWRVRPAAGALTAVALLATTYLANLARTAGIDLPAAVCSLAFLLVAGRAIERGSVRGGLAAGFLFGLGFLFKETVIPFAPIPFLVALLGPVSARHVARVGAAALLAATAMCGWWFVLVAAETGTVYRLGGPAWLLVPIGIGALVLAVAGLWQPGVAAPQPARPGAAVGPAVERQAERRIRRLVAWAGLVLWLGGQLAAYARAAKLGGAPIVRASQLIDDVQVYLPQLGLILGFSLVGSLLAVALARRSQPVREIGFGAVAQVPLIVLVLGIGETPRHYIAAIGLAAALGAAGWVVAVRAAMPASRRLALVAAAVALALAIGAPQLAKAGPLAIALVAGVVVAVVAAAVARRRIRTWPSLVAGGVPLRAAAIALIATFLVGAGFAAATAYRASAAAPSGDAEARAVEEVGGWLRANVEPGRTVMVGPALAYELALAVHDQARVVRFRPATAIARRGTPFGLAIGGSPLDDPVTAESALHVVDQLDVYERARLSREIRSVRPAVWVEAVYASAAAPNDPVLAMFDAATGVDRLETWSYPFGDQVLIVVAYGIDPDRFAPQAGATFADPDAIEVLAGLLRSGDEATVAGAWLGRLRPVPAGAAGERAIADLRAVASP